MIVREAQLGDIPKLAALGAATFTETFGHLYKPEDLAFFINQSHSEHVYRDAIEASDYAVWVVDDNGTLAGYLKLCPNGLPCDPPLPQATELSKIYILADYQNKALGQKLLDAACDWARSSGYAEMVLSVFSENYAGHRFYQRNGFVKVGEYEFPVGKQLDREWIMMKTL